MKDQLQMQDISWHTLAGKLESIFGVFQKITLKRVFIELNMLADTLFTYGLHLQKNQVNLVEYLDGQLVGVRQTSMKEYWFFTQE